MMKTRRLTMAAAMLLTMCISGCDKDEDEPVAAPEPPPAAPAAPAPEPETPQEGSNPDAEEPAPKTPTKRAPNSGVARAQRIKADPVIHSPQEAQHTAKGAPRRFESH